MCLEEYLILAWLMLCGLSWGRYMLMTALNQCWILLSRELLVSYLSKVCLLPGGISKYLRAAGSMHLAEG